MFAFIDTRSNFSDMFSFTRNSYFLAPKRPLCPSSIPLGSVITTLIDEHQILANNMDLSTAIDTEIQTDEVQNYSGKKKFSSSRFISPFSFVMRLLTKSPHPVAAFSSREFNYAYELMETRSFKPSPEFLAKVAADPAFKSRLESSCNVYVVTGVKIANRGFITISVMADVHTPQGIIPIREFEETPIDGEPMLFALQVEKVGLTRAGKPKSKAYVKGAWIR